MKCWPRKLPPVGGLLAMIVLTACSLGDATSPAPLLSGAVQKQLLPNGEVAQGSLDLTPADTQYTLLSVNVDRGAWHTFGPHKVFIGKQVICDPATSGYGLSYWLQPCTYLTSQTLTITAKYWTDSRGYARAEFKPDLRFHPGRTAVSLYLKDPKGATQGTSAILYCVDGTNICVNESLLDPVVATNRDASTGWVWRIIRHFSGYNVWA